MNDQDVTVNLQRDYSAINEGLTTLFDALGVRRSFTVPYVEGANMADHVRSVGAAAKETGGLTQSLVTTAHHSKGKGWGSGDGQTVGHQAESLKQTIIPKDDQNAAKVIRAAQKFINDVSMFLGDDDPVVRTAQSQLDLVKKTSGAGMNALHFGYLLQNLVAAPLQAISRAHHATKPGAHVGNQLMPPRAGAVQTQQPQPEQEEQQPSDEDETEQTPQPTTGAAQQ